MAKLCALLNSLSISIMNLIAQIEMESQIAKDQGQRVKMKEIEFGGEIKEVEDNATIVHFLFK